MINYSYIILFDNQDTYGFKAITKMGQLWWSNGSKRYEFIGKFNSKEELKKLYPNTSIRLHNDNRIPKYDKELLSYAYRKDKIFRLLKNEELS